MHVLLRIGSVICACLCFGAAFGQEQPTDPMAWSPPHAPPSFRGVLPDAVFRARLAAAFTAKDKHALSRLKRGAMAIVIRQQQKGSQAEKLDLKPGLVIVSVGGKRPTTIREFVALRRVATGPQEFVLEDEKGVQRVVSVMPGRIGVLLQPHYRKDLGYFQGKTRDPKTEDLVLAALKAAWSDPDLAETAWHHAVEAGYRVDGLALASGADVAYAQLDYSRALAFCHFALKEPLSNGLRGEVITTMMCAARTSYRLPAALDAMAQPVEGLQVGMYLAKSRALISHHRKLPDAIRLAPPPSDSTKGMERRDLLSRLKPYPKGEGMLVRLQKAKDIRLAMPAGLFSGYYFHLPAGVKDVELTVDLTVTPHGDDASGKSTLAIGLGDPNAADAGSWYGTEHGGGVLSLVHAPRANCAAVYDAWWPVMSMGQLRRFALPSRTRHVIRMFRFNGRHEVLVDEKRVHYGIQGYDPTDLFLFVKYAGLDARIHELRLSEIVTGAAKTTDEARDVF